MRKKYVRFAGSFILVTTALLLNHAFGFAQDLEANKKNDVNSVVLLNPYDAVTYINNYRKKFCKRNTKKHTQSVFLDSNYFNFIGEYFKDHPSGNNDGIRIFFASYHRFIDDEPHVYQAHKKQITLIIAPTKDTVAYLDSFNKYAEQKGFNKDVLNHGALCPNSCDNITGAGVSTDDPVLGKKPTPLIFLEPDTARRFIHNYRRRYCRLWNKKHSKSLWMPRQNFEFLYEFFRYYASSKKYAGIRIFFASYNKYIPKSYNARKKQITLIFTAALSNRTHDPDFSALLNFYDIYTKTGTKVFQLNENHGELCPNACNNEISDPL